MATTNTSSSNANVVISKVSFYSSNDSGNGYPEVHHFTREEYENNVGVTLSTGETLFTQFPEKNNYLKLKIINGFTFIEGKYGRLLAIKVTYSNGSIAWIEKVISKTKNAENTNVLVGNWIEGKTIEEIHEDEHFTGTPLIGNIDDYIIVQLGQQGEAPTQPDDGGGSSGGGEPTNPTDPTTDPSGGDNPPPIGPKPDEPTDSDEPEEPNNQEQFSIYLSPANSTIMAGDTFTINVVVVTNTGGAITSFEWAKDGSIVETQSGEKTLIASCSAPGTYKIIYKCTNEKGVTAKGVAFVTIVDDSAKACNVLLKSDSVTYKAGTVITVETLHNYPTAGTWDIPSEFYILDMQEKRVDIRSYTPGVYKIKYNISNNFNLCIAELILTIEESDAQDPDDTEETPDKEEIFTFLKGSEIAPLYKYPQKVLRNARYRGPRESLKVLQDHQEALYDIRKLMKELNLNAEYIDYMKGKWLNRKQSLNNFLYAFENNSWKYSKEVESVLSNYIKNGNIEGSMIKLMEDSTGIVNLVTVGGILENLQLDFKKLEGRVREIERTYK